MRLLLLAALAFQLPTSETLSPTDAKEFNAELQNLKKMLDAPVDHATVTYAIARTYAAGGQWPEAIEWLNKSLLLEAGIDPAPDKVFQKLRGTSEFNEVRDKAHAATPPVIRSKIAFSVDEDDLSAEGIAYDTHQQRFYIGSTTKHKIVECSAAGECRAFAEGLGEVLGIKIAPDGTVWAANNTEEESGLFHFAVPSGKLLRKYLCLGAIDGLSFYKGSLIAIQNGVVADRIARFDLSPDGNSIAGSQILERRHPQWDGITTGAIAAGWYYYMANVDAKAHPTTVLKLPLDR